MSANGANLGEAGSEQEQEVVLSDIQAIFLKHLPTRLTSTRRFYAAQIRKTYELGSIDETTVINLCKLIRSSDFTENSLEEKIFLSILGISSSIKELNTTERDFLKELIEWMLVGVLGKDTAELLKKTIISSKKELTDSDIESLREEYSIRASKIVDGAIKQKLIIDFRSIPVEILPFLSEEVRKFMFQISRKNYGIEEKVYDTRIISYKQNEVLRKSLQVSIENKEND